MDNRDIKPLARSYNEKRKNASKIICTLSFIFGIFFVFYKCAFWAVGLISFSAVFPIALYYISLIYSRKYLDENCDPELYGEILLSGYKRLCVGDIAEAAYLSGDMHSVKKIAENGNYGEKDREKISRALAGVYFDSGDMENLKKICNDSPVAGRTDPLWSYYGAYLDGDYLKCAYVCAESFRKVLSKADKVVSVYLLAVAEYAAGDFENAEENFRKVIANGKYLNCVKISELYLESLYTGRPYITEKNAL